MNARQKFLLPLLLFLFLQTSWAQVKNLGQPKSWGVKEALASPSRINMSNFDEAAYRAEDEINDAQKIGPWRFGHNHEVNFNLDNSGNWVTLPNGDRIWRFHVKSKDALSLNFIFENFFLPENATLYIYKPDRSFYQGAYTSMNNNAEKVLGTDLISGEEAIIEYFEPAAVNGQGTLTISTITHGYRDVTVYENSLLKALNSSGNCNRDVRCLTDNEPLWLDQSRSVAMIVVNGNGSCTGTLVNNTAQDGTPYFLTANHCLGNPASWAFRFKWISPNPSCATTTNSTDMPNNTQFQTANGSTLRARNAGSDVALVQINNLNLATAQAWGLYYAGWDHTGNPVNSAIGIHHPSGDIMKYARENQALVAEVWEGAQCWRVSNWDEGVTEPGSSGSALFDMNRRIIGQLYGGGAACSGTNDNGQPDWYGRFDVSWENGGSASSRLRDWLDPSGISTGVLDGFDPNSPSLALDAGIESIEEPSGDLCGTGSFTPIVELRNYGSDELTTVTINYNINGGTNMTFNWTGNLAGNSSVSVTLPTQTVGAGAHTFTASTSSPNGGSDEDPSNDEITTSFNVNLTGNSVNLELILDCFGEETTWIIQDESNTTLYSGGPYVRETPNGAGTINENFCLNNGCYSFTIYDSYGDGLNGSTWGNCNVDGDYTISQNGDILAQLQEIDFGDEETVEFCVGSSITPNFEANSTAICAGETIDFTDLSEGAVTSWSWSFEGGTPSTSSDQNPTVTYSNAGTYDVTLTIGDGTNTETLTLADYIVVNALPTPTISTNGPTTFCAGESVQLTSSSASGNVWSTGVTTQSITVSTSGSYTVTVTDGNGCTATSAATNVVVNANPTISLGTISDPSSCGESDGSIQINGTGSGTLSWTGTANGSQAVSLPHTVNSLASGSYTFIFTNTAGCESNSVSQSLSEPGSPAVPTISASGPTTLCQGESVTLTASTGTGITWSTGATTQSITVNSSDNYSVTVTDGTCSATSVATSVTVNPIPTTPTISTSGSTAICSGESVTLTSSYTNGNLWSNGATTQSISVNTADTYSVSATVNGCESTTASITITEQTEQPIVVTASGATTFCDGGSVTLTSSVTNNIVWSSGQTTASITVSNGGSYSVSPTSGCFAASSAVDVIVHQNPVEPVISSNSTILCDNGSIQLTSSATSGNEWSTGSLNQSIVVTESGNYTVTATNSNGCISSSSITISQSSAITVTPTIVHEMTGNDGSITIAVTGGTGPYTYSWSNGSQSQNQFGLSAGTYTVTVTDANGCSTSADITLNSNVSITEKVQKGFNLFPNPTNGIVNVEFEGIDSFANYVVSDALGKTIDMSVINSSKVLIDLSNLQKGVYFIRLIDKNNTVYTERIILQ